MKKKMVCIALFSVLGLGGSLFPAQATSNKYALTAEVMSQGALDEDGLPPNYELEFEETDQPFIADESFLDEEEGEDVPEVTGTSLKKDQKTF